MTERKETVKEAAFRLFPPDFSLMHPTANAVMDRNKNDRDLFRIGAAWQASQQDGWISVDDLLPPLNLNVLVREEDEDETDIGCYTRLGWYRPFKTIQVTHWMKLPEPPKNNI